MNKHRELRIKLDKLNTMEREKASEVVAEVLKYLMDIHLQDAYIVDLTNAEPVKENESEECQADLQ